jgi:hypothetical protein
MDRIQFRNNAGVEFSQFGPSFILTFAEKALNSAEDPLLERFPFRVLIATGDDEEHFGEQTQDADFLRPYPRD